MDRFTSSGTTLNSPLSCSVPNRNPNPERISRPLTHTRGDTNLQEQYGTSFVHTTRNCLLYPKYHLSFQYDISTKLQQIGER
jgi:hypothetical protein